LRLTMVADLQFQFKFKYCFGDKGPRTFFATELS
jgi:hypothetical protein